MHALEGEGIRSLPLKPLRRRATGDRRHHCCAAQTMRTTKRACRCKVYILCLPMATLNTRFAQAQKPAQTRQQYVVATQLSPSHVYTSAVTWPALCRSRFLIFSTSFHSFAFCSRSATRRRSTSTRFSRSSLICLWRISNCFRFVSVCVGQQTMRLT